MIAVRSAIIAAAIPVKVTKGRGAGPYPAVEATKRRFAAAAQKPAVNRRREDGRAADQAAVAALRAEAKANAEAIAAASTAAAANQPWLPTFEPISAEPAEWFT